jgi:hypothetical protein
VIAAPRQANAVFWGEAGHRLVGEAAAAAIPAGMPGFFRAARAQLAYLNPEPDRWRDRTESSHDPALNGEQSIEHYIDLEAVPGNALAARDRYAFLDSIHAHGGKGSGPGLLPYRTLELAQRLRIEFGLWRSETDTATRRMIEERIINDAGLLGHYVADGSNPHHTTVNHDRWVQPDNPKGFTTKPGFHSRFESDYVRTHIKISDVQSLVARDPKVIMPMRAGIWAYLHTTWGELDSLYALDKVEPFGVATTGAAHKAFTAARLAAGATMLRDLWWTAWETSRRDSVRRRPTG